MAPFGGAQLRSLVHGAHNYVPRRAMSRLFVGGLSFTTEEEGLRTAFSKFGEVIDARIVTDRESGRSRGFGFVTFLSEEHADIAKQKMSGQFLDGRVIRVDRATPRPPPPRFEAPPSEPPEQAAPQDWGSISSPIAAVPQNVGLAQASSSSIPSSATSDGSVNGLPDLSTLASPNNTLTAPSPPFSFTPPSDPSPPTKASTKDTGPSFDFIDLDLSNLPPPDPNRLARRRPPRIRPSSMADYEFGYYMSETSKFPFNTNFETGFQKPKGPDYEFDFTDIREAAAAKKAEELALKKAKETEEAALLQAKEEAIAEQAEEAIEGTVEPLHVGLDVINASNSSSQGDTHKDASTTSQGTLSQVSSASSQVPQSDSSNAASASVPEAQQNIASELQQAA